MLDTGADMHNGSVLMMSFSDAVAKVAEQVAELGLFAEEMLRTSAFALFGTEYLAGAKYVLAEAPKAAAQYEETRQRLLDLLGISLPTTDEIHWVVELQRTGAAFRLILDHATRIARHALDLDATTKHGNVEQLLAHADMKIDWLYYLVRQPLQQIRDAVVLSTTRSTTMAQALILANDDLHRTYVAFDDRMTRAIAKYPLTSYPLQLVLLIAAQLEAIGNCTAAVGTAVLGPPSHS